MLITHGRCWQSILLLNRCLNLTLRAFAPGFDEFTRQLQRLSLSSNKLAALRHDNLVTGRFFAFSYILFDRSFKSLDLAADLQFGLLFVEALHDAF